jgi:hypothetical protein
LRTERYGAGEQLFYNGAKSKYDRWKLDIMGEEGGVFTKDSTNFFSDIGVPWWEHEIYTNVVNDLRQSVKDTEYREIWIVTSGPISTESIDSVQHQNCPMDFFNGML